MLKCSDAVLQLECLTASWQKQKPTHPMEKGGYRMAGAHLVSMPISNSRCGAWSFHLPRSTWSHGPRLWSIFLTFSLNHSTPKTLFSAPSTLQTMDVVRWPQCQPCPFLASLLRLGATAGTWLPCATQENGCATSETSSVSLVLELSQASRQASSTKIYAVSSLSMRAY